MRRFLLCALTIASASAASAQVDVLTQHNDKQRSGANLHETTLNTTNVPQRFHLLWELPVDGQVAAQPLYVSGLKTKRCPQGCDAIIVCTMSNTVYVYRADTAPDPANPTTTMLWDAPKNLGPPQQNPISQGPAGAKNFDMFYTNDPSWGILSTPVVNRAKDTLYVVAWNSDNGGSSNLHSLDLFNDGIDRIVPARTVAASAGAKHLDSTRQKQRAALLLDEDSQPNPVLYLAFTSANEHSNTANGWVIAYEAKDASGAVTLKQLAVWCSTPTGSNGGVWAAGSGLAQDSQSNVYLQTGNGTFDAAPQNRQNFGESLVKLKLQGAGGQQTLVVQDFFTPCAQEKLSAADDDLGSSGPMLIHNGAEVIGGGKQGLLYHMSTAKLGGYSPPPQPTRTCDDNGQLVTRVPAANGHIHGAPVFWQGQGPAWVYVWGENSRLNAFPLVNGRIAVQGMKSSAFDLSQESDRFRRSFGVACQGQGGDHFAWMPGGIVSVSSDGATSGTGIVWALVPANGDANSCRGVKGMLMAFDADDISKELWRSQAKDAVNGDGPDSFGLLARFVAPTVAGGRVFVATFGDKEPLRQYGGSTRPATHVPPRPGDQPTKFYVAVFGLK